MCKIVLNPISAKAPVTDVSSKNIIFPHQMVSVIAVETRLQQSHNKLNKTIPLQALAFQS